MLNIGVVGCTGRLGKILSENILADNELQLFAVGRKGNQFVGKDISEIVGGAYRNIVISDTILMNDDCDVYIDCTNAETFINQNAEQYLKKCKSVLIATTGFSEKDFIKIEQMSKKMPILFSANYSISLYTFIESLKIAAKNITSKTDVNIIEMHHNRKIDAPSGTAIRIQEALCESNTKLEKDKIAISSIRGGNIFGEHRVVFANENDEVLEYIHSVYSRGSFAAGIIEAAKWLIKQAAGYYAMNDFLESRK